MRSAKNYMQITLTNRNDFLWFKSDTELIKAIASLALLKSCFNPLALIYLLPYENNFMGIILILRILI